MEKSELED